LFFGAGGFKVCKKEDVEAMTFRCIAWKTEDTQKRRDLKRDVNPGVDRVSCLVAGLQLIATPCRGPAPTGDLDVDDERKLVLRHLKVDVF
jgi:hypothetical protein